ncbi:hypothetical protein T01_10064 [Trichinella spiralis]|uniref:Uncharacterized protein n=1 Tax=Trichinella spiralis TaxID=6334 RepID=A0A0V1BJT5_TRISP|nr:hypothetical protein T01_10064 [Trichinella spiralis]
MALPSIGPEICVASLITGIRNHVDKYVITKHYQLMPLSLATYGFRESVKGNMANLRRFI